MKTRTPVSSITIIMLLSLFINGCLPMAAVPLLIATNYAVAGFSVYKMVQTTTGGKISVSFGEEKFSPGGETTLATMRKPAVWPGSEVEVAMTEKFLSSNAFEEIVTPAGVARILDDMDAPTDSKNLTHVEQMELFGKACVASGADGIIAFQDLGNEFSSNSWSFKRAAATHRVKLLVYSSGDKTVVYETVMEIREEIAGKVENPQEVMQIAGINAAEKVLQLAGRKDT